MHSIKYLIVLYSIVLKDLRNVASNSMLFDASSS